MKTAIYKLLNIKVEIVGEENNLLKIKPLEKGVHWYEAKVHKNKLRNINNEK